MYSAEGQICPSKGVSCKNVQTKDLEPASRRAGATSLPKIEKPQRVLWLCPLDGFGSCWSRFCPENYVSISIVANSSRWNANFRRAFRWSFPKWDTREKAYLSTVRYRPASDGSVGMRSGREESSSARWLRDANENFSDIHKFAAGNAWAMQIAAPVILGNIYIGGHLLYGSIRTIYTIILISHYRLQWAMDAGETSYRRSRYPLIFLHLLGDIVSTITPAHYLAR